MKMAKSSQALVDTFGAVFPEGGERRQMFGFPCGFVNGNMFAGLFEESLLVRVNEADTEALLKLPGAHPFAPMGRPMRGYTCVPAAMHDDRAALRKWMGKALAHAASLPPKVKKSAGKSARKATKAARPAAADKKAVARKR